MVGGSFALGLILLKVSFRSNSDKTLDFELLSWYWMNYACELLEWNKYIFYLRTLRLLETKGRWYSLNVSLKMYVL